MILGNFRTLEDQKKIEQKTLNLKSQHNMSVVEKTIVRENLINQKNYTPYCGNFKCKFYNPRTYFNEKTNQFHCNCGWESCFDNAFLKRYSDKWCLNLKLK